MNVAASGSRSGWELQSMVIVVYGNFWVCGSRAVWESRCEEVTVPGMTSMRYVGVIITGNCDEQKFRSLVVSTDAHGNIYRSIPGCLFILGAGILLRVRFRLIADKLNNKSTS